MRIRREGRRLVWLGPAALALSLLPQQALAEGCLLAPAKLSDATMQAFKDNPKELLERFPAGGPAMSADVMRRAGSDLVVLPQIIQIAREGTTAHRVAIGIGLARAASACSRTHPEMEQAIKRAIADAGLSELSTAFAAGLSSLDQTAAVLDRGAPSEAPAIGNGPSASIGGNTQAKAVGAGGAASSSRGIEFLTTPIPGSTFSNSEDGVPTTSVRSPTFSTRNLSSTVGDSVSPTRR
jgi:hypothetical protein